MSGTTLKGAFAAYTSEQICERIFRRHAARIQIKKPNIAIPNLVRIVEAFLKLATRKGFHATSLRDLATASGLSMGGLYSYFDSKDALLVMVLEEVEQAVTDILKLAPPEIVADPRRHLDWVIATHIKLTEAMGPWFVFAYMEAKSFPKSARDATVESELVAERAIAGILERGIADDSFRVGNVELTAAIIKPLLQDWYVKRGKYRKRGVSVDTYIATVQQFVQKSLAA